MPSGRGGKPRAQTEELRFKIWNLYLGREGEKGLSQRAIGAMLGITQQAVNRHVRHMLNGRVCQNEISVDQYLARELILIADREAEAGERYLIAKKAWKKSIGTVRVITKTGKPVVNAGGSTAVENPEVTIKEETVVGDPRLLRAMEEADESIRAWHSRRCRLLGLEAPKKIKIIDESDPVNLPDSELEKTFMQMAANLKTDMLRAGNNGNSGNGHNGNGNGNIH